ncbi:MAG: prepilin-type N-terminal cleavage/methylation domain-containing protein [Polaromonas sp.]|nr:prepilin-type N-terminal cleavage/methylation domain-containing protein [Polaromonas sp.]
MRGFTLIELLVAIGVMALMAGLSWRGLDGMARTQSQVQQRSDGVLTLQAGLAQWAADLDAMVDLPAAPEPLTAQLPPMNWDGRGLRIIRRSTVAPGSELLVVAWAQRNVEGAGQWLRWQSRPLQTRAELQSAWDRAAQWAQNPGDEEKRDEVRISPLAQWQVFYFRSDAWTNPLSSDSAATTPEQATASALTLPAGVRLVLTLPPGQAISGTLTRDWVRPTVGGGKS